MFRWVAPEPRCALVVKNLLRAATLAGYSNFLHQFVFIFLGLMLQSLVLCRENRHAFVFNMVRDEPDMLRREEALARVEKVQEMDLSYQVISSGRSFFDFSALCSLCKLDLSHNQLDDLPASIGFLLSLTHLFLNDNYLSSLWTSLSRWPGIIRRLANLQELDLRNNKLNNFSLDITELSCLRKLSVQGNPLKDDETRKLMKLAHNERWIDIAGECKIL